MNTMPLQYAGTGAHVASYYAASSNPVSMRPALKEDMQFDVCVVGAGYTGLSTALHLAEQGHNVAILEGARIGWGASGRNGGQIVNGLNASLQTIERRYDRDTANFVANLVMEGGDIIRERVKTYGIECDLKPTNVLAGYTDAHLRALDARLHLWEHHGIQTQEMLSRDELRDYVGSDVYAGGLIDHAGGHMHPLNFALGEAAAFEQNGGTIFEQSMVIKIDDGVEKPVVQTQMGSITCKTLVLCGNAYLGKVVPTLATRVMPVSTQIMATEPLDDDVAARLLPTDSCIEDTRFILDYFRMSADKRLLFGGGTVYGGTDPKNIELKLRRNMEKVFPELQTTRIEYAWSGNFALSFSRVPQMGRLNKNVYFAHGYSGHGVTGSQTFGRILSEAITGDIGRFDVFEKMSWTPFPGGHMFRVPYSMMGSWYYGFKDRFGF
ncbi:MAG: FAD-binding oxidoreductase [Pseudoruegeria sp.]